MKIEGLLLATCAIVGICLLASHKSFPTRHSKPMSAEVKLGYDLIDMTKMVMRAPETIDVIGVGTKTTASAVVACTMYHYNGENDNKVLGYSVMVQENGQKSFSIDDKKYFLKYCADDKSLTMQPAFKPFKP